MANLPPPVPRNTSSAKASLGLLKPFKLSPNAAVNLNLGVEAFEGWARIYH